MARHSSTGKTKSPSEADGVQAVKSRRGSAARFLSGNAIGKQFKPGQSGNPSGRRDAVTESLRRKLAEVRVQSDGRTNAELVADALLEEAIEKRNIQAIKEIF